MRSQICVPTFADAHLPHSTACATLARHRSDPRGELSRVFERLGIAHAGNNRGCGDQANARYLSNALASRGLTQLLGEPAFDLADILAQLINAAHLLVQPPYGLVQ